MVLWPVANSPTLQLLWGALVGSDKKKSGATLHIETISEEALELLDNYYS